MVCPRRSMKWKRAMQIARRHYPKLGIKRRRKVAAAIARLRKRKRR